MNVVVTGASTGIGRATVLKLASLGHRVFAGIRKVSDGEALRAEAPAVQPVVLDVTNEAHITEAVATVDAALAGEPLHGLVNNAGVGTGGPVEYIPLADWRHQLEVNLVGPIAVTRAFLPAIRRSPDRRGEARRGGAAPATKRGPGRIVNVTSIGGKIASPFMGPYCASKFALEAVSDALRIELRRDGIGVVIVEPGSIATPIWGKAQDLAAASRERFGADAVERYGHALDGFNRNLQRQQASGIPPERVADAIVRALSARRPPARILVGTDARVGALLKWMLPDRWFDALIARM